MYISHLFRFSSLAYLVKQPLFAPEEGADSGITDDARDLADLADIPDEDGDDKDADEEEEDDAEGEEKETPPGDEESKDDDKDAEGEGKESAKDRKAKGEGETDETGRPTVKALKGKYPDLFKDFPYMKQLFFAAPKVLEVFADAESASEAMGKAQEYDLLNTELTKGTADTILQSLEENNPKALKKLVTGFAESIRGIDDNLYIALSEPIIEELIYHAAKHGEKTGNKNLQLAARHLANYVFANGGEIPDISKRSKKDAEPSEAEKELELERRNNRQKDFDRAAKTVGTALSVEIKKVIDNKLDGLSTFESKQIIKETESEVDKVLSTDKGFQRIMAGLWKKASEDGFSDLTMSRVKRAWLDRARQVAPAIRNRLRQEALDAKDPDKSNSNGSRRESEGDSGKKRNLPSGGRHSSGRSRVLDDPKKIDWSKTSDRDILDS